MRLDLLSHDTLFGSQRNAVVRRDVGNTIAECLLIRASSWFIRERSEAQEKGDGAANSNC